MAKQTIRVINKLGLHARAAAKLVKTANQFDAEITLTNETKTANGKSIMNVMMLAAGQHSTLELSTSGVQADEAMQAIVALFENYFGEGE